MSAGDNREHHRADEQESWTDLFGSVFESADEATARITPAQVEERLNDTIRRAGPRAMAGGMMYLSLGRRSFTVTVDVDRPEAGRAQRQRRPSRPWLPARMVPPAPGTPRAPVRPASFWAALDPAEQLTFQRLAGERRYAAGDELMREGETAGHVVVILAGRARVSVQDGARQRVVAYRGPGELIGERAALQVSVRSATVVAVEPVVALVMRSQDFAAFVSAHPAVLTILEAMVYERLTEEPVQSAYGRAVAASATGDPSPRPHRKRRAGSPRQLSGEQCTVVAADVVGLGNLVRNDEDRHLVRQAMAEMTRSALTDTWKKCFLEDHADGMVIAVPAAVSTLSVVERLTSTLPAALRRHNRIYNVCAQIQMRIAVDTGPVHSRGRSLTGKALDRTRLLLETPALTRAINSSRANLGMIVSSSVYDTTIRPLGAPVGYQQVRIEGTGAAQQPWMQVIDPAPERLPALA